MDLENGLLPVFVDLRPAQKHRVLDAVHDPVTTSFALRPERNLYQKYKITFRQVLNIDGSGVKRRNVCHDDPKKFEERERILQFRFSSTPIQDNAKLFYLFGLLLCEEISPLISV